MKAVKSLLSTFDFSFHLYDKLPHIFPESCLLITLGILVGVTLYYTETASSTQYTLDANTFFLFLLPPIIYDAGYHMPNRAFFHNLGTILLLAVVNTLWNTVGIGIGLWGMSYIGWIHKKVSILHAFVFAALISAVDPVAVLAIFEEIQVNEILYIIVFGESLLNDGVTVVIYRMMEGFTEIGESNLEIIDFATGVLQFFIVCLGGTLIGVIYGLVGAFITKYTDHVRVIEPLFIFVLGYLAYLTSEIMELSGILALTFGGIIMRHYTEANMTKKSTTTVKYFMKLMANISETIIFMFLGLSTVIDSHDWQLDFILFAILFCLIFRVTGVVFLSSMVNRRRLIRLSPIDQFIMSYGGLRGGIAFCLALLLDPGMPDRAMFVTTTLVIVFFTVFIQGITIKPVVNALKVERAEEKDPSMNEMLHKRFIDHLMAGVEDIVGKSGHNSLFHKFDYYNSKYLKPWLLRENPKSQDTYIVRGFTKLNMQDAKAAAKTFPGISRDPSFINFMQHSHSMANLLSRRATIGVPNDVVLNLPPEFAVNGDNVAMQNVLEESMFSPRSTWVKERRHTLAEVHNHPPFRHTEREHLRQFISDIQGKAKVEGARNGVYATSTDLKKERRKSLTSTNPAADVKVGDTADTEESAHETASNPTETLSKPKSRFQVKETSVLPHDSPTAPEVVFTLGMPAPAKKNSKVAKSPSHSPAPVLDSSSPHSNGPNKTSSGDTLLVSNPSPTTNSCSTYIINPEVLSTSPGNVSCTKPINIPSPQNNSFVEDSSIPECSKSESECCTGSHKSDMDEDDDRSTKEETLAESSLPWRRTTSLPPVPSSVSLSLPDDENPLMSEAPSWADNLAYSHLTETGSPYQSPNNTITAVPKEPHPRPVFDIFPPSTPPHSDTVLPSIPPPWSFTDTNKNTFSDEPLPSMSLKARDAGDKASCFLVSAHDLVPPSYHSCLEPNNQRLEPPISRRHSEASSPVHFQLMEKPESVTAAAMESQLIGIEEDYHHGMTDRVAMWLANHSDVPFEQEEIPVELCRKEEGEQILESLRKKKQQWTMGDTDDGTDADVESDDDLQDTRL
ncbi:sodium/hydrogen exchanger 2-like [Physella acuta]|uniref:sodium/hydrogen exchanger 2-like n=1 Tax=Physella acuta TaxID=109671 RepID=UPI0027DE5CD9|nr:sodium/hydrogen exchanger 2-like [Physella acuta]